MIKRIVGSVLIFESIAIILAIPVAIQIAGVPSARAWWLGGAFALATLVVASRVDRRGGIAAGWVIQALVIASALIVPIMAILGVMFALLYYGAIRMVDVVQRQQAAVPAPDPLPDNGA